MTTRPRSHASLADLAGTLGSAIREAAQDAGLSPRRVQIPVYTDHWMRGDRYGEIVKITSRRKMDRIKQCVLSRYRVAHVKLDKSGLVRKFLLDDCTEV